jgi:hypothetical protein
MATARVIPIKLIDDRARPDVDPEHDRLEAMGYLRMILMSEPRLSELVEKFKMRGYEVMVLPSDDGCDSQPAGTIYVRKLHA